MFIDSLLSLAAPHACKGCGQLGHGLCLDCFETLVDAAFGKCLICSAPVTNEDICPNCKPATPFDRVFVVGENRQVLKKLLYDFKFGSERGNAVVLSNLLDSTLPILPHGTVVVPTPTIPPHIRQRGFGHIELVARTFAKKRQLPYANLLRRENSAVMHGLDARERRAAAKTTFSYRSSSRPVPHEVLLIDDIFTTGSTVTAAAKLLKASGVGVVNLAVIARHTRKI